MPRMRRSVLLLLALTGAPAFASNPPLTEETFRESMNIAPAQRVTYRDLDCKPVNFTAFATAMQRPDAHADVDRATDDAALTLSVRLRGGPACPSPYPPLARMPAFELRDLAGRRVNAATLRGKPTLMSFFFSTCMPCILEVEPLNRFAAARPQMNFLAVTFDEADVARQFVKRFGLKWRVLPDARDFVDRVRVKQYPTLALFDADGRLLGMKKGGAGDALEAANVEPQLNRWVDGLLRK